MLEDDDKYLVIKHDDVRRFREKFTHNQTLQDTLDVLEKKHLYDAVVIRTQDVFAAAGLQGYANNIEFYLALFPLTDKRYRELEKVCEYFREVAIEAADRLARKECKLPD